MPTDLSWAFFGGAALGAVHFATLWLTVRRLPRCKRPLLALGASSGARLAVLCTGIYLLSGGRWQGVLAAVLGVLAARLVFTGWLGPRADQKPLNPEGRGS